MRAEWDEEEAGSGGEGMTKPEAICPGLLIADFLKCRH